ncbi:pentatricopeptide repeat-containing protein [Hordeum vulgare]|nr:pentatricopeptide repeat-containing protein [Hordeum vulgare]
MAGAKSPAGLTRFWSEATAPPSKPSAETLHILSAMAESSIEIKTLLKSLLKRVESVQLTVNKHVEAQLAFNEQVSSDLAHLRKQVDQTQTDVDEVRRHRD